MKTFESLFAELTDRAETRPAGSGTVAALDAGVHAQGKKLLEEAGEVWIAAEHEDDDSLALEISQLIYRAQVIMIGRGISWSRCTGISSGLGRNAGAIRPPIHMPLAACRMPRLIHRTWHQPLVDTGAARPGAIREGVL